jgi:hypothetical protein
MTTLMMTMKVMYQSVVMNPMNQFPFPRLPLLVQFSMTPLLPVPMLAEAMASISLAISHKLLILKLRDLETPSEPTVPSKILSFSHYPNNSAMLNMLLNPFIISLLMCKATFRMLSRLMTVPNFVWKCFRCRVLKVLVIHTVAITLRVIAIPRNESIVAKRFTLMVEERFGGSQMKKI